MNNGLKRAILAGVAVLALGAGGFAYTATHQTPTAVAEDAPGRPNSDMFNKYQEALANRLHVTVDQLKQAQTDARKDAGFPDHPQRPRGQGGPNGQGGQGPQGRGPGGPFGAVFDAAAKDLGMSTDDLRKALPGKSIADIAKDKNVDINKIKADMVAAANAQTSQRIDDLVNRKMPTPGQGRGPGQHWGPGQQQ